MHKTFPGLCLLAGLALAVAGCARREQEETPPPGLALASEAEVEAERAAKDRELRTDPDSPIPQAHRAAFQGLQYYRHDPALRFAVKLRRYPEPVPLKMVTTSGQVRPAVKAGYVEFEHGGARHRLQVYQLRDPGASPEQWQSLFLPFLDRTSAVETYGAGRYVDLAGGADGWYVLDFNRAYHPLCAYGRDGYVCPRTPEENRLPFAVRAGERGWVEAGQDHAGGQATAASHGGEGA